jgi:hypothetical protein
MSIDKELPKVRRNFVALNSNLGSPRRLLGLLDLKSGHPSNLGLILDRSKKLYLFSEWFNRALKPILSHSQ